jgi:hypothetical protein
MSISPPATSFPLTSKFQGETAPSQDDEAIRLSRKIVSVSATVSGLLASANQLYQMIRQRASGGDARAVLSLDPGPLIAIQSAIGTVTNGIEDPLYLLMEIQKHLFSRSPAMSASTSGLLRRSSRSTIGRDTPSPYSK